ncbi:hypothetical protein CJD36_013865 [Flavipsychrobacter stenotrophus]|uniref:Uncharacterized protein n=1 Tax=Flavipsychrobacter stenotrophus TaxID=2077091 RepID=A0A2S7SWR0_9BACT|nr:hypothetical protein [Flavipsychrobacter stenotrophus]PQJ11051.1 hypothetical protein CJD36_013865 [Flavipsychrobacter stenotrophus]
MTVMAIKELKKQVKKSIDLADDTTVRMIHAMLEVQQQDNEADAFEEEIDRRFKEMDEGKGIILTVDEFMTRAKNRHEAKIKPAK